MVWKQVSNSDTGDADHVGGDDWDKLMQSLSGSDVDDFDINLDCKIRSAKLQLRNPANTFAYVVTGAAIVADRILNLPLLTATDTVVTADFIQTLTNKTVNATNNTITDTSTATGDILKGNGTKFVRMGKGTALQVLRVNAGGTDLEYATAAGSGDVLLGAVNNYGDFDNSWQDNRVRIWNPANTFRYTFIAAAIAADRNLTLPLLTGNDTVVTEAFIQTLTNKTLTTPVLTTPTVNGVVLEETAYTSNHTMAASEYVARCDASGGAFTITLPTAVGIAGQPYKIVRTDILSATTLLTVDANGSQTIDGLLTWKLHPGESISIISDGANWVTLSHPNPTVQGYYFNKGSTNDRRYVAGVAGNNIQINISTTSPTANMLYAFPLVVGKSTKFDIISFNIDTAQASKNARAGIYYDNGNMYPGALIFDTSSVSTASTGMKNTTITSGLQFFQPGLYWLTFETDATTIQVDILFGATATNGMLGYDNTQANPAALGYKVAHTYGALPDPYTAGATILTVAPSLSVPYPAISLRPI